MSKQNSEVSDLISFKNSQGVKARGTLLKLSQNYIVFEVYNPYSIAQLSEVLHEVKITRQSEEIYNGKAVVSNLINTGLLLIISATLVDSWSKKFKPTKLVDVNAEALTFVNNWQKLNDTLSLSYRISISKIRSFLSEANRWMEQFNYSMSNIEHNNLSNDTIKKVAEPLLTSLSILLNNFESESRSIKISHSNANRDDVDIDFYKKYAQKELHPLIMQAPFVNRIFYKPLGYAGDYEMVNMMLRDPLEGETPYAKLINLFFLQRGPAEAHRNRIDILYEVIKSIAIKAKNEGRVAKIFNFACGPAIEIQRFIEIEKISENCEFTLLDFSNEALNYTKQCLENSSQKSGNKVKIKYINKSVHEVLKYSINLDLAETHLKKDYDLVYCAGLFDYLSDKICAKLLKLFFWQLKTGATMLTTNVHSSNPVKLTMENLMEWYLIYRDEESFSKLVDKNLPQKIYTDQTGINIFLEVYKL